MIQYNEFLQKLKEFELIKDEFDDAVQASMRVIKQHLKNYDCTVQEGYIVEIEYNNEGACVKYTDSYGEYSDFYLPARYFNASWEELKELALILNQEAENKRIKYNKELEIRSLKEKEEHFERLRKELGK